MSQEILFLLFLFLEGSFLVLLYTYWIVPTVSKNTVSRWERKMLEGDFDLDKMVLDHLMERMSEFMITFFSSAAANAAKRIGKTEEGGQMNLVNSMLGNLKDEPWYIQALAPRLLGLLETAGVPPETASKAIKTVWSPGLDRK